MQISLNNYADRGAGWQMWKVKQPRLRELHYFSYQTKAKINGCFIIHLKISRFLTSLPPRSVSIKHFPVNRHSSESSYSCWHLNRCWFLADTPQNAEHIHRAYTHFLIFLHLFRSLSIIRLFSPAYVSCETLKMQPFLFLFLYACAKREVIVPGGPSGDCGNWG